jgi:hypothetical protein
MRSLCLQIYDIPSSKHTNSYAKWTIEIGVLPIQIVIFYGYVSLPEGKNEDSTNWRQKEVRTCKNYKY